MGHNYHHACGCSQCDRTEAAEEARDEYIAEHAPAVAAKLPGSPDFAIDALKYLQPDAKNDVLEDVAAFFEAMHNARATDAGCMAIAAAKLWRKLLPYIEDAALADARDEVAAEYDARDAGLPWDLEDAA